MRIDEGDARRFPGHAGRVEVLGMASHQLPVASLVLDATAVYWLASTATGDFQIRWLEK